ncbi:MAG: TraR/DksA C4-type zinc finger protein [Bryobacteraceae bacterium]|jgi:DnaK suppressor protein
MDLKHFERKLLEKQGELKATLAALEGEASESGNGDVRDPIDDATVAQGVSEAFEESGIASETLEKVEAALARIRAGSYGKCIACGRPIGTARLEAVPWAEYCLEDQEKQDQGAPVPEGATL